MFHHTKISDHHTNKYDQHTKKIETTRTKITHKMCSEPAEKKILDQKY
jgi:hypothetical protein